MKILKLLLSGEDDTPMGIQWGVLTDCWCGYKPDLRWKWDYRGIVNRAFLKYHIVSRHG